MTGERYSKNYADSYLVFGGRAVGDVVERHLEGVMLPHLKLQDGAVEIGRAPVPALHAQLLVQHVQAVAAGEVGRHPLPFRLLKARKPREQNTLLAPLPVLGENFFL